MKIQIDDKTGQELRKHIDRLRTERAHFQSLLITTKQSRRHFTPSVTSIYGRSYEPQISSQEQPPELSTFDRWAIRLALLSIPAIVIVIACFCLT